MLQPLGCKNKPGTMARAGERDGEMAMPGGVASLVQHNGAPPAQTETETQFNSTHL